MPAMLPPPLPRGPWRRLRPGELDHEALWLGVSAGAVAFGCAWLGAGFPLPLCPLKTLTGCPCPTCGATRAVLRLAHGDLTGAFLYNPLVVLAGGAGAGFDLYAGAALALRRGRLRPFIAPAVRRWVRYGCFGALAVNWAWVIYRGN